MDFSSYVKFINNLIENQETTITYSGYLFQNNSDSLKIVYGFGDNWMYTKEQEMKKTENGFVATIKMLNFSKFNFCFKNSNNQWDNNYNKNFTASISEFKINEEFVLNQNVIENILINLIEKDISEIGNPNTPILLENFGYTYDLDKNVAFEVNYIKNEPINIENSIINVSTEKDLNETLDKEFTELYGTNTSSEKQTLLNDILHEPEKSESQDFNIENLINEIYELNNYGHDNNITDFSELFEEIDETEENDYFDSDYNQVFENYNNFENSEIDTSVDNIVTELVDNLYENSKEISSTETASKIEENNVSMPDFHIIEEEVSEEPLLIETLNDEYNTIDNNNETSLVVSARSLSKIYSFRKKFKLAMYKLFTAIPKILSSNFEEGFNK